MPEDLFQSCLWPGVTGVASCQYVCSHGISPGKAILVTYPQFAKPREYGTLSFSDGKRRVDIRGCKVDSVTPQHSSTGGTIYTLEILDERWAWAGFGGISGHYNKKDKRQKLVPWTIRSPRELAQICLDALGIRNAVVQLPQGLTKAAGANVERYLARGENFPQTFTNPEVQWTRTPPAEALAQLADFYGCRVIYQPNAVRILVVPPGTGKPLPNFPYESVGDTIDGPEAPEFVGVFGAPVKIQARFMLEAVGEEWDGSYVPINQLSYSPVQENVKQVSRLEQVGSENGTGEPLMLGIRLPHPRNPAAGLVRYTFFDSGGGAAVARFNNLAAQVNGADSEVAPLIKAEVETIGGTLGITFSARRFFPFDIFANHAETGALATWCVPKLVVPPGVAAQSWKTTNPPIYSNVQATDRLAYSEAKALAQKTVYRCYRILNRDPHDKSPRNQKGRPMDLPFFGKVVKRRQQIVLQDSKVDQVKPQARIPGAQNLGNGVPPVVAQGVIPEFYNGYSRDQANTVSGSVSRMIGNVHWLFQKKAPEDVGIEDLNTGADDCVYVSFTVDQTEQMIIFSEPVFRWLGGQGGMVDEPELVLEAGCFLLHPDTDCPYRWEEVLRIPGGTAPTEWTHREDVDIGIIGLYGPQDRLIGFNARDLVDGRSRAGYYMRGQAAKYKIKGGSTRQYTVIVPHDPDGFTQQVTWMVGESGPTTIVSGNTEHNPAIPPYPARRRAENLPANKAAAAANMAEREFMLDATPKEQK